MVGIVALPRPRCSPMTPWLKPYPCQVILMLAKTIMLAVLPTSVMGIRRLACFVEAFAGMCRH